MLTEIALVLSLAALGVALALLLSRWTLVRATGSQEARRLISAATRAAEAFLFREGKYASGGVAVVLLLVLAAHGAFVLRRAHGFGMTTALWAALATIIGAGLTVSAAYVATEVGLRATLGAVRATVVSLDAATTLAARASGVTALATEALTTGAVTGLFALVYLLGGGGAALGPAEAAALMDRALVALPGLAIGSITAALVLGVSSSAYHVSAGAGGHGAEGIDVTDAKNPSFVAMLVAEHVGLGVRRTVDTAATLLLAHVATLAITVSAFRAHAAALGGHAWALVTLPLVIRAVGLVASAFGLMTARATESGLAVHAVLRGQLTASVLAFGGVAGASLWLLSGRATGWLLGAGSLGILAAFIVTQATHLSFNRQLGPLQELLEATRVGRAAAAAKGLSLGFRAALVPVTTLAAALVGAFQLGQRSHVEGGAELAMATAFAGLLSTSAFMLATGLVGPITSSAFTIALLEPEGMRPETRRRAALLDDGGFRGGAAADTFFVVVGSAAAIVAGLAIGQGAPSVAPTSPFSHLHALALGAVGAAGVLYLAGRAVDVAGRAARGTVLEVERQLRGFPREGGAPVLPTGFTPSYRVVIDLASKLSIEGVLPLAGLSLLGPVVVSILLRALYGGASPFSTEALSAFVVLSGAMGLLAALFTDGAQAAFSAAYRENRPRGSGIGGEAALPGHELGSFLGGSFSPAVRLFVKATAAAALFAAPFLTAF